MFRPESSAGLIKGSHPHLLDHLAPLCNLLNMVLLVTDETIEKLCKSFYPEVRVKQVDLNELTIQYLSKYDYLFSSTKWQPDQKSLFFLFCKKSPTLIFVPHGNSDKGHIKPLLEPFCFQDHVFLYGMQMIDHLKKQNLFEKLKGFTVVGNFRLAYYLKDKTFQDFLTKKILFSSLDPKNKTLLYAPTWNDFENLSSFSSLCQYLIDHLPKEYNLVVKPHPLIKRRSIDQFIRINTEKKNVLLLDDFPYIYSLLSYIDGYIGDFSSIGYDFLYFNKPMFFFDKDQRETNTPSLFLHRCGISLNIDDFSRFYKIIDENIDHWPEELITKQSKVYTYAFGKTHPLSEIKEKIFSSLQKKSHSSNFSLKSSGKFIDK